MQDHRIRTTQAWRDGLYAGHHASRSFPLSSCLFVFLGAAAALALCSALWWSVGQAYSALTPITPEPTAEAEIIYEVVPGDYPDQNAEAAAPAAAPAATRRPGAAATPRPTAKAVTGLNGVPLNQVVVISEAARQRIRQIYAKGQASGRNPRSFAKVGDSTMEYPAFLAAFESASDYKLGMYSALQPTINHFDGSFGHTSPAVKKGMHTWTEFDPSWNNPDLCHADETPLDCEFRLANPAVVFIRLGANDVSAPNTFQQELRKILDYWIDKGVVPILGTKPDRQDADNSMNKAIRAIAASYKIPLWDYDLVAGTVPNRGLENDLVHMKGGGTRDYTSSRALAAGDSLEDLTALMALDAVRRDMGVQK